MDPIYSLYAETALNLLLEEKEEDDMLILEAEKRVEELHDKLKKKRTKTRRRAYDAARAALDKLKEAKSLKMQNTYYLMRGAAASFDESEE